MSTILSLFAGLLATALLTNAVGAELKTNLEYDVAQEDADPEVIGDPIAGVDAEVRALGRRRLLDGGGGWNAGDKSGGPKKGYMAPMHEALSNAGFAWFSINYRLAPRNRWPACFEDVRTAIRWVKAHAAEFKGDPTRIALFGHSAGGHLACLAATQATPETRVQAVVGFAPVTDFEFELPARGGLSPSLQGLFGQPKELNPASLALLREAAPINHVTPGLPPFLLLHGDADKTVPLQESVNFQEKLKSSGVPCDLMVIPGAPHRLAEWEKCDPNFANRMILWLRRNLGDPPAKETPPAAAPAGSTQ